MASSLLIAGCGYTGLKLARLSADAGWAVYGLRRSASAHSDIEAAGAQFHQADLLNPAELNTLPVSTFAVYAAAPSGKRAAYRATYVDGLNNWLNAFKASPAHTQALQKLVFISSTSVYGNFSGSWVDEKTPARPDESGEILLEAEKLALQSGLPVLVIRLGGIYGPGRDRLSLIKEGIAPMEAPDYLNQIHVEDAARLVAFLLEKGIAGEIYLGVDDEPVIKADFYAWLAKRAGITPGESEKTRITMRSPRRPANKRCSNAKIKALGFSLRYPNAWQGFGAIVPAQEETA